MCINSVQNEREYEAALARIDAIWDAEPGTSESDELDALAILVEAYEEQHHPVPPPDPIGVIVGPAEQKGTSSKGQQDIAHGV